MNQIHHNVRSATATLVLAALSVMVPCGLTAQGAGAFVEQQDNLGRGFDPTKAFDSSGIDTVNTFNGNLSLAIPLGLEYPIDGGFGFGLSLRYNSSVWDFKTYGEGDVDFWEEDEPADLCGTYSQAWPSWTFNAGMGWELSLGRLYEGGPTEDSIDRQEVDGVIVNSDQPIAYIGPDGSRHEFFPTLHDPQPVSGSLPFYTRDGSYLRLRCTSPSGAGSIGSCSQLEVAFPTGGRRLFQRDPREPEGHGWRVTRIEDAFGNHVQVVDYDDPPTPTALADRTWHLQDSQGRNYWIHWTPPPMIPGSELGERAFGREVVTSIDVPGMGGARLVYGFHYDDVRIDRTCRDNYPWGRTRHRPRRYGGGVGDPVDPRESQIWIRRLARVTLPDGTDYEMEYYDPGETPLRCAAGLLERVDLPTGGATEWSYGAYEFPTLQECPNPSDPQYESRICSIDFTPATLSVGVFERRLLDSDGSELGRWTYQHNLGLEEGETTPVCGDLRVLQTVVTDPLGHQTEHFYSGYVQGNDDFGYGWRRTEYGLPFTREEHLDTSEGPLFLSTRRLECAGGTGCSEVSRSYVRYELDPTATVACSVSGQTPDYCLATNARVQASRVVYTDTNQAAGEHSIHTESSDFDGLGHYRTVETTAENLPGIGGRTTFTSYNPGFGPLVVDHGAGTASPFTPPSNWVLETFTERRFTEGGLTDRQQFQFDQDGFLRRLRAFKNTGGSSPGASAIDVITVFTPDAKGNEVRRERHGGASDPVPQSLALAGLSLGAPDYRVDQTWEAGVLKTSHWVDPADATKTLSIVDNRSIDASTGRVTSSADPSGLVTSYGYDSLGRMTSVSPPGVLPTRIEYDLAARPVSVRVGRGAQAAAGTAAEPEQLYLYDGIGRLTTDRARLPGSGWSEQITGYLGDGSVAWVTDRHPLGTTATGCSTAPIGTPARGCTRNLSHDAFGRPTRVLAPDGGRTDLEHFGIRKTVSTQSPIASVLGATSGSASQHVLRDFAGRVVEVHERSAGDGSLVKTAYEYDAGGRLTVVDSGMPGQADRLFFYDGRGFLASERHPEMSSLASQPLTSVLWADHDSLGNPGRRTDADSDVSYDYDFAGRLVRVSDLVAGEPVAEYFYARSNHPDGRGGTSRSAGKLHQSRRYNRLFNRPDVVITETFEYAAPGGRLSRTSLRSSQGNGNDVRFSLELDYDALGELATIDYPDCEGPARCDPGLASRQVERTVERGLLRRVRDLTGGLGYFASEIVYDASGLATSVARGNGVTDSIAVDPSGIPRPQSFSFAGPFGSWTSGGYSYDGRGDVYRIGADKYRYDPVGRLLEGEVFGGLKRQVLEYDRAGNITTVETTDRGVYSPAVDSTTNRLNEAGVAYSGAGKLVQFRDRQLSYDALERPVAMTGPGVNVHWAYDADGERVALFDLLNGRETWTLRGPDNRVLRRYRTDAAGAADPVWQVQDYVYQGSKLLATVDEGGLRHLHPDHLGTPRLVTSSSGNQLSTHTYYPFGEEVFPGSVDHAARRRDETMRFTGHERDVNGESAADPAVDDLDYMHARYYSPFYGRFLSPDPVPGAPEAPQSWNRYVYAGNSPLAFVDVTGGLKIKAEQVRSQDLYETAMRGKPVPILDFVVERTSQAGIFRSIGGRIIKTLSKTAGRITDLVTIPEKIETAQDLVDRHQGADFVETAYSDGSLEKAFFDAYQAKFGTIGSASGKQNRLRLHGRDIVQFQNVVNEVIDSMESSGDLSGSDAEALRQNYDVLELARRAALTPADRDLVDGVPSPAMIELPDYLEDDSRP